MAKAPVGSPAAMGNAIRRFESFPLRQLILETLAFMGLIRGGAGECGGWIA